MLLSLFLLVVMGGLIYAAVQLWHFLDVKASKTKKAFYWAGFVGSIALAIVCGAVFLFQFVPKTPNEVTQQVALLESTQDTLKRFSEMMSPAEKEAILYEMEQSILEMQKRLAEINEMIPEVRQMMETSTEVNEKRGWQDQLNELLDEQAQLKRALASQERR